jgi:hypothetical protein
MPTKTSVPSNSCSKRKPTRAHSWPDADGVQNETAERNEAFRRAILAIPTGKVSTHGGVAAAAGYPRYHRFVARLLHGDHWDQLIMHARNQVVCW